MPLGAVPPLGLGSLAASLACSIAGHSGGLHLLHFAASFSTEKLLAINQQLALQARLALCVAGPAVAPGTAFLTELPQERLLQDPLCQHQCSAAVPHHAPGGGSKPTKCLCHRTVFSTCL